MGTINGVESDLPMVGDGQQAGDGNTNETLAVGAATQASTIGTATSAEVVRVCDSSARVVATTATALSLTVTEHAERVVLVNSNSTVANTFTLPAAGGTGERFTIVNNVVQTQGTVVVAAAGTDVMNGIAYVVSSTEESAGAFLTSATSDKISLNLTTTGGLGHDKIEAIDVASGTWNVQVTLNGSGTLATPFSAT